MKKVRDIFGKKGFGKGSPRFMNCLSARFSAGREKDGRSGLFSRLNEMFSTVGAGARGMRPGRLGAFFFCPAAPKKFGRAARRVPSPSGRSMIEMLAVLAIIGVLSVAALVGFTYAMNKHRANETIYDVMLRGTNVPMIDEYYYDKASGYEFRFPGLVNNGRQGTYYPMTTKKDAGSSYYVEATGVTYRVCELILKMNPTDIDQIVVNNSVYTGDSDICGNTDGLAMKFCFGEDGTICDGTGHGGSSGGNTSGGSGTGSGSGSGSGTQDCTLSKDCTGTLVCIAGTCQEPDPNTPCVDDTDCPGDQACTSGTCQKPTPCTTSADCDGNLTCTEDGECKNPNPCTLSKDCTGTLVCIAGTCQEPDPNTPCVDDTDCPGDQACTSGTCQKPTPCTTSADCDGNLTCTEDGECKNPNPCTLSKDCTGTLVCIAGTCQEPDPNTPCVDDTDCPGDQACTSGTCQKPNSCTTTSDCADGLICTDGECKNPEPCSTDTDCPGEQICTEGTCTDPVLCTSDENCPTGQICMEGICYDPCPYEDKPYIDPDSPTYICVECLTDAHCADRTDGKTSCDPTNKVCQQSGCTSNDDCETGYFCAFQNASGCSDKDKGTGECKLISLYGISDPIQSFFYSEVGMTWWSAQNWCAAQGATLATRESVGCPDETYRCTSDILTSFKSWNKTYGAWLEKKDDDCNAYYMRLYGGDMFTGTRHGKWGVALCHG